MKHQKPVITYLLISMLFCLSLLPVGGAHAQAATARVGVFDPLTIPPGADFEIPIQVKDVTGLYAIDLEFQFDPAILEARDADPTLEGVQMGYGEFLEPGLLLYNKIDNQTGTVQVVITQINPAEPKSGSGILFVLYGKALKTGSTELVITKLQLASMEGLEIPAEKVEAAIKVEEGAPAIEATPIPIVDPTSVILIPTVAPNPISTLAPTATPLLTLAAAATQPLPTEPQAVETEIPLKAGGFSLAQNWWIVVLVLAVAAGLAIHLFRMKSQK